MIIQCLNCNEKYEQDPIDGKCVLCRYNTTLTIKKKEQEYIMDNFINGHTVQLLNEYSKAMDRVMQYKIGHLKYRAFEEGEYMLFKILDGIDTFNIDKTRRVLEQGGYTLELEHPQVKFTNENIFKATIQADEIKLKVKKVIFEV